MLQIEEWTPIIIDGIDTDWQISSLGRAKNKYGVIRLGSGTYYRYVGISKNGRHWNCAVHRLVATAFIPNPENKPEVNHIDGDKHNNCVKNLEWATRQENADHAAATGLMRRGEAVTTSKLNESQVHEICRLLQAGVKRKKIAKQIGCPISAIHDIYYGNTWKHISKDYTFKKFHSRTADIRNVLLSGVTDKAEICRLVGLENNLKNRQWVKTVQYDIEYPYVKKRKPKALCSTTIPSAIEPTAEETFIFAWEK